MAKRIVNLKVELEQLKEEESRFDYIKIFSCKTGDEFEKFKNENLVDFERLKFVIKRIREIEWELMTPEEKENRIEYLKKWNEKYKRD